MTEHPALVRAQRLEQHHKRGVMRVSRPDTDATCMLGQHRMDIGWVWNLNTPRSMSTLSLLQGCFAKYQTV